jgi:sugar lactone lactonase YvrE
MRTRKQFHNHLQYLTAIFALGSSFMTGGCTTEGKGSTVPAAGGQGAALPGEHGLDGEPGRDGKSGPAGKDGEPGKDGTIERTAGPNLLELTGEKFFPEGTTIDTKGALYVGSIPTGEILRADLSTGILASFSTVARSAIGMLALEDVLLVCDVGLTTEWAEPSAVLVLDLMNGAELARHVLPEGALFCNDLAIDESGNVYATESFGNAIYKIAADDLRSSTPASLFSDSALFSVDMVPGNFGLNGIDSDGQSLYVANFFTGSLFEIIVNEDGNAGEVAVVQLTDAQGISRKLDGPDGLKVLESGLLMIAEQGRNWLSRVELESGEILPAAGGFDVPSTFALDETGDAWVVNSQLDDFMGGTAPILPFTVKWTPLD